MTGLRLAPDLELLLEAVAELPSPAGPPHATNSAQRTSSHPAAQPVTGPHRNETSTP